MRAGRTGPPEKGQQGRNGGEPVAVPVAAAVAVAVAVAVDHRRIPGE